MRLLTPGIATIVVTAIVSYEVSAQSFRVATFNVNYGNTRGDEVLRAVNTASPDVLCLQETTLQSEGFLSKHLATTYPEFRAIGHEEKYYAERFVFASKLMPRDITFNPPKAGLFGSYATTYTIGNKDVRIVNVHLTPFGIPADGGLLEAMAAVSKVEEQHAAEITAILNSIDPAVPTIICGDFNSLSTFKAPKMLAESGFTDSFAAVHDEPDKHVTWEWPTRPLPLRLRIDYVFHSSHFETVESTVVERTGSDHFLLVSELKFVH